MDKNEENELNSKENKELEEQKEQKEVEEQQNEEENDNNNEDDEEEEEERFQNNEELGISEMESLCMSCMENGKTRMMIHKIPYFRELIIASFECPHCGERNNEVTFGGEIQIQGCRYELLCTNENDLNRQLIKSDSASVVFPALEFEIPPKTQKGEISTIEGFISTAARNLSLYQRERMEQDPVVGMKVADIIRGLQRMVMGEAFPFVLIVNDPAGNSFVENLFAPKPDPNMKVSHFNRTPEEDVALGLQPEHGTYRKDTDTNLVSLIDGSSKFGLGKQDANTTTTTTPVSPTATDSISFPVPPTPTPVPIPQSEDNNDNSDVNTEIGRQEVVRIPDVCPNCSYPGETLTALTDIPHFKEVIIMAFTCTQCGYKNSEVKGGGAVPTYGTEVSLRATSPEDLKRDILKSDSAKVSIAELELELEYGTLGGVYTTVEGLLQKIEHSLRDSNPFVLGDSSKLHHDEELKQEKVPDKFEAVMIKLKEFYTGQTFPFTLTLRDPLGNSFISAQLGTFTPPESDPGLTIVDFTRSWEENEEFGLNDINTRDFETGVDYHDNEKILPDRVTHVIPKGADHPTPFAQGCPDNTPGAMYFPRQLPASLQNPASSSPDDYGTYADPQLPSGWKSLGPQWGPLEMINELGCPPVIDEENENNNNNNNNEQQQEQQQQEYDDTTETVYVNKRQFNEGDFKLKFQPREEFGGPRNGFVFRMGAQGLGYYEDIYANQNSTITSTTENHQPIVNQESETVTSSS